MSNAANSLETKQKFNQFIAKVQTELDQAVHHGTDHELFIASYLTGHFSLLASHAKNNDDYTLQAVEDCMITSLNTAFANKELAETDQQQVLDLWQRLFRQYS